MSSHPKTWKLNLYHPYFVLIAKGSKTVEGRAWSPKRDYRQMKKGEHIIFTDLKTKKCVTVTIQKVVHYPTVKKYLEREGLHRCLPTATSLADGIGRYYSIAPDWEHRIRHHGIFAIRISLEKKSI